MPGPDLLVSKARDVAASVWTGMTTGPDSGPAPLTSDLVNGGLLFGTNAYLFRDDQNLLCFLSFFRAPKVSWGLSMDTPALSILLGVHWYTLPFPNVISFPCSLFWGISCQACTEHSGFSEESYQMDFKLLLRNSCP